jgi:hypothetical protein
MSRAGINGGVTLSDDVPDPESASDHPASLRPTQPDQAFVLRLNEGRRTVEPRHLGLLCALLSIVILASQGPVLLEALSRPNVNGFGGVDYRLYMDATQRWLDGGPFYQPYQLLGPYPITAGDILYPPVALWLFVPFTFLPSIIWWLLPIGLMSIVIWRLRPVPISWPLMALCLAWPPTQVKIITGNPVIWSVAALALGCLYRWPSVFVLLKPSLLPFALFGVRHRAWWIALGGFALLSLPFGALWMEWLRTVVNSQGGGILYSVQEVPLLLLPLVAWRYRSGDSRKPREHEGEGMPGRVP